jgi:hypothetical protein
MSHILDNLRWVPSWISHLGCVKGCLNYLNIDISMGWLFGGSGHAFILNIGEGACPSGPTAWKSYMLSNLGRNLGYASQCVFGTRHDQNLATIQEQAWNFVKESIDDGIPCYGWELEIPEFYVIYGYDDIGYFYSGTECDDGKGPKAWNDLGDTGIGIVEVYNVKPHAAEGAKRTVKEALAFALEFAQGPDKYLLPDYKAGAEGYDLWIKGVEGPDEKGRSSRGKTCLYRWR